MDLIKLFLLGASGYFLLGMYDLAQVHHLRMLRHIFSVGFLVTILPYCILLAHHRSPFALPLRLLLSSLTALAALATLYIAALEIPLRHTEEGVTYRRGSYAQIRHPGFHAHLLFNVLFSLTLFDGRVALLCALFVCCNLILITVEDRILFPKLFPDYVCYTETTGFLLPKRRGYR